VALTLLSELPESGDEAETSCQLCQQTFTAHRYLYTHLSDLHFAAELDADLPNSGFHVVYQTFKNT
jgi:hypothetical protein